MTRRLKKDDFCVDAVAMAKALLGAWLCRRLDNGTVLRARIVETEAYFGEEDTACHAHHGRTPRTDIMYSHGGFAYVYLCYGMHNLLNIVTGQKDSPQAVLIRGVEGFSGPGRLTKAMGIDRSFNAVSFVDSDLIWLEDDSFSPVLEATPRIGIQYASEKDQARLWRFVGIPEIKGIWQVMS